MRRLADAARVRSFLSALGRRTDEDTRVYLTGGGTAVLLGWRHSTVDADILIEPERDALYSALPGLKEELQLNVELANPAHFIPELPGWRDRSLFIVREGGVSFYHYDLYAQALAKIERGHGQDLSDALEMVRRGLVAPAQLRELFLAIAPRFDRYPAVDPPSYRRRLDDFLAKVGSKT